MPSGMKHSRRSIHLLLCLIPLVKAYTVFETTCSAPVIPANYVSSPNTRGTLDILWSSFFTILACAWTLQHPSVSEKRGTRDPGKLGDIKWALKRLYRSTLPMLATIIVPELAITAACLDLLEARQDYKEMQDMAGEDGVAWSLSHCYYANMGGFVIRIPPAKQGDCYKLYHVNTLGIYELRKRGGIKRLPDLTTEDIKDTSKSDVFAKVIALGQMLWSAFEITARLVRRLPVSPLEVAVVAFAVCAVFIYGLYWDKPQRVGVTTTILTYDGVMPYDVLAALERAHRSARPPMWKAPLPGVPIGLVNFDKFVGYGVVPVNVATTVGAAVFGGIHAVAWNFAFPSTIELTLWRCATIYAVAAPIMFGCVHLLLLHKSLRDKLANNFLFEFVFLITLTPFSLLYIAARFFILVEMFWTLCFLPPGSYVSIWTSNMPHVA